MNSNEPDARKLYADIIDMPHHRSETHPHMSLHDRAAQFAPFAALTGYDDMIDEEARLVDNRIELDDESIDKINRALSKIRDLIDFGLCPEVTITYFVPDPIKPSGGKYVTSTERIRKVDGTFQKIILERCKGPANMHVELKIADIFEIHSDNLDDG